jgi:hypothetical protein
MKTKFNTHSRSIVVGMAWDARRTYRMTRRDFYLGVYSGLRRALKYGVSKEVRR